MYLFILFFIFFITPVHEHAATQHLLTIHLHFWKVDAVYKCKALITAEDNPPHNYATQNNISNGYSLCVLAGVSVTATKPQAKQASHSIVGLSWVPRSARTCTTGCRSACTPRTRPPRPPRPSLPSSTSTAEDGPGCRLVSLHGVCLWLDWLTNNNNNKEDF